MHLPRVAASDLMSDHPCEVHGHGLLGQAGEVDLPGDRLTDELDEGRGMLVFGVAMVDHEQQKFIAQRSRQVLQQKHRGTISPVRVIEDQD